MFEGPSRPTALVRAECIGLYRVVRSRELTRAQPDIHPFNTNPLHVVLEILVRVKNDSEPRQSRRPPTLDPGEDLTSGELAITF